MPLASPFPEELRATAAAELFLSSAISRYSRACQRLVSSTEIKNAVALAYPTPSDLVVFVRERWAELVRATQRTEDEVEIALALAYLQRVPGDEVDLLFKSLGMSTVPVAGWIAALARTLFATRPTNFSAPLSSNSRTWSFRGTHAPIHISAKLVERALGSVSIRSGVGVSRVLRANRRRTASRVFEGR